MEFLVQIDVNLPSTLVDAERAALLAAERDRGGELKRAGTIVRIWRIPGRLANVGVWSAADASALHEALCSLPVFAFTDVRVTPLAVHHLEVDEALPGPSINF